MAVGTESRVNFVDVVTNGGLLDPEKPRDFAVTEAFSHKLCNLTLTRRQLLAPWHLVPGHPRSPFAVLLECAELL